VISGYNLFEIETWHFVNELIVLFSFACMFLWGYGISLYIQNHLSWALQSLLAYTDRHKYSNSPYQNWVSWWVIKIDWTSLHIKYFPRHKIWNATGALIYWLTLLLVFFNKEHHPWIYLSQSLSHTGYVLIYCLILSVRSVQIHHISGAPEII